MMRSLYSAVSGLKTHQTRMDVIGNNISNVNTEAFKASQVHFSEIMYQTTASASLGNGATGIGGVNAKQIGLGVATASTTCNITGSGAAETTGNPFDLRLTDSQTTNFYIVSDGTNTMFTRAGSFYVDGNGYLCMSSTGYTLQGWQVDPATGEIRKDTVSPLQIMSPQNQTSAPEATDKAYVSGIIDKKDSNLTADGGYVMTLGFYDDLGYPYTAKFSVKPNYQQTGTPAVADTTKPIPGCYHIELTDILDSKSVSILPIVDEGASAADQADQLKKRNEKILAIYGDGTVSGFDIYYDENEGTFVDMGQIATRTVDDKGNGMIPAGSLTDGKLNKGADGKLDPTLFVTKDAAETALKLNDAYRTGFTTSNPDGTTLTSNFSNITLDFSRSKNYYNGGTSTMKALKGAIDGEGMGKKVGALTSLSVDQTGKIYGAYDNGNTELLGQIAVAQFANASGLEKVGSNCYMTTLNSGEFDGIGVEVDADGSKINSGELEMSNVDLSGQFTDMIVTQRGFQANSRVITTSDTLLEELINLKR